MDVRTGRVPDYRTFVRHVWTYEEPGLGRCVAQPPWVYSVVFEDGEEARLAQQAVGAVVDEDVACHRLEARKVFEGKQLLWEFRFRDLEALHLFLVHLAVDAVHNGGARQVGEFLMWTLGFRWV